MLKRALLQLSLLGAVASGSAVTVAELSCEHLVDPQGIPSLSPRLGWRLFGSSSARNVSQTSYQVQVANSLSALSAGSKLVWDSGQVNDAYSATVAWTGPQLQGGQMYYWRVRSWISGVNSSTTQPLPSGTVTDYSEAAAFSTGFQGWGDWPAGTRFISLASAKDGTSSPWLRLQFQLSADVLRAIQSGAASALLHVASVGFHEAFINGQRLEAQSHLFPSISYLPTRVHSHTYGIGIGAETTMPLVAGSNALGLWVNGGWAQWPAFGGVYPKYPLVAAALQVVPAWPGPQSPLLTVVTNSSWTGHESSYSHIGTWQPHDFGGDAYNQSAEMPDWATGGASTAGWEAATEYTLPLARSPAEAAATVGGKLIQVSPEAVEPTQIVDVIPAVSIVGCNSTSAPGCIVLIFRDIFTGWVNISASVFAREAPGRVITLQHSTNYGSPNTVVEFNQVDQIVVGSGTSYPFVNKFSYHETQYVTITGLTSAPSLAEFTGLKLMTARKRVGSFESSNGLLTSIYDATVRTVEGLTTGGMTVDCPHRERRGYGGDGHTSLEFAMAIFDRPGAFYGKWAIDFADVQAVANMSADQTMFTAPTVDGGGGPGWSGFMVTMPWHLYSVTGDVTPIAAAYPHMTHLIDFMLTYVSPTTGLLQPIASVWDFLGDWETPHGSEDSGTPESILFNNCYLVYILKLTAQVATILGDGNVAANYTAAAAAIGAATHRAFYNASSTTYLDSRQTHLLMPLVSGLVPSSLEDSVKGALEREITVTQSGHLDTGLHGTYFLTRYLTSLAVERDDLLFLMSNQTTFPSYGWLLSQNYTTWPEEWPGSGSRMHGCFNGIGLWFQQGLLGVRLDLTGQATAVPLTVKPAYCVGDVTWARGSTATPYGLLSNEWTCANKTATSSPSSDFSSRAVVAHSDGSGAAPSTTACVTHSLVIPGNAQVTLWIPSASPTEVYESGGPALSAPGVCLIRQEGRLWSVWSVGSGSYNFSTCL